MTNRSPISRARDFESLGTHMVEGLLQSPPPPQFLPHEVTHLYVKLELAHEFEFASNQSDARKFLRSVSRAAMACASVLADHQGRVLEVQGSMLHLVVSKSVDVHRVASEIHGVLEQAFLKTSTRILGWCMAAETGKTLFVVGQNVHEDDSWVSLGTAANRPAKFIYSQVDDLNLEDRKLARFTIAVRNLTTEAWDVFDLEAPTQTLRKSIAISESVRAFDPDVEFYQPGREGEILKRAAADSGPQTTFGWVFRSDLDGFSARVDECVEDDAAIASLAEKFWAIMAEAKSFAERHSESVIQLPWAGDCFSVAAVQRTREDYLKALEFRYVDLSLDFDKYLKAAAQDAGFEGWAHSIAGGEVHPSAGGNVFVGQVRIDGKRFLLGAGKGFGRTSQGFAHVSPSPGAGEIVAFSEDCKYLNSKYRAKFSWARNVAGQISTLFMRSEAKELVRDRALLGAANTAVSVSVAKDTVAEIPTRPWSSV